MNTSKFLYSPLSLLFLLILHPLPGLSGETQEKDYLWNKRVLRCSSSLLDAQTKIFKSDISLIKDLKLVLISEKQASGCQLIGLDGEVKAVKERTFSIQALKELINSMPMRQFELEQKKKNQ